LVQEAPVMIGGVYIPPEPVVVRKTMPELHLLPEWKWQLRL
jgi:hypothetical protein